MKRSWIGLGLLVALMISGLAVTVLMARIHEPITEDLTQAARCVRLGDWENGERFFVEASEGWTAHAHLRGCFADHTPTEEIDALFAQLRVYCQAREDTDFTATCMALVRKVAAVGEAHGLHWWNML